jgi:hypothetical protein
METIVLCLANSKKLNERCVAGIDVRTGDWVRPVSRSGDHGAVPFEERQIDRSEPQLLDLIAMDLAHEGPTGFEYCHARENRWIEPSPWRRIGRANAADLGRYCSTEGIILHSGSKFTRPDVIHAKPLAQRHTLELRWVNQLRLRHDGRKWRCSFVAHPEIAANDIPVTDPELLEDLKNGKDVPVKGFAVISLGVPAVPRYLPNWDQGPVGWKLLAAWIPAQ